MPVLREILREHRKKIHGLIHVTGGGQTKVLKFVKDVHIIKDNLFELPPLFRMIQESSQTSWREMYQVFNMGQRLELYLSERYANQVIDLFRAFGISAARIGRVEANASGAGNRVTIVDRGEEFHYTL